MTIQNAAGTSTTQPTGKPCSGCRGPRTRGETQRYCHGCHADAQERYREKLRDALNTPAAIAARLVLERERRIAVAERKLAAYDRRSTDSRFTGDAA